jgi:hypothetical protein
LPLLDNASLLPQELLVYTVPDPSQIPHTWIIIFNNNGHIPISFFFFFFFFIIIIIRRRRRRRLQISHHSSCTGSINKGFFVHTRKQSPLLLGNVCLWTEHQDVEGGRGRAYDNLASPN